MARTSVKIGGPFKPKLEINGPFARSTPLPKVWWYGDPRYVQVHIQAPGDNGTMIHYVVTIPARM